MYPVDTHAFAGEGLLKFKLRLSCVFLFLLMHVF